MGSYLEEDFMNSNTFIISDRSKIDNLVNNTTQGVCGFVRGKKGVIITPNITKDDTVKSKIVYLIPIACLTESQLNLL